MSVAGYIGDNPQDLRMPCERTDDLGTNYEGAVLSGEASPEERRLAESRVAMRRGGEFYSSVEDYDPVLRSHCRL